MRKRLRKKKHVGEFQIFGVEIAATLKSAEDFDSFLDDFICDPVEANDTAFGGGGGGTEFSGFLELGRHDVYSSNLDKVANWLAADSRVESYTVGKCVDAWNGHIGE